MVNSNVINIAIISNSSENSWPMIVEPGSYAHSILPLG